MRTWKKLTQEEIDIIRNNAKEMPKNLKASFEVSAKQIGRSVAGVTKYYYNNLNKQNENCTVACASATVAMPGKNAPRKQVVAEATNVIDAMLYASCTTLTKETAIKFLLGQISEADKAKLLSKIVNKITG